MHRALLAIALASAISPTVARAQAEAAEPIYGVTQYGDPPPRRRAGAWRWLAIGGGAAFGAAFVTNAVAGLFAGQCLGTFASGVGSGGCSSTPGWDDMRTFSLIPLAGPWIQLAIKPTGFEEDSWAPFLLVTGLLQAAGLGFLIAGAVMGLEEASEGASLSVTPFAGPDSAGLTFDGRF